MVKRNVSSFFIVVFLLLFYLCPFVRGEELTLTTYYPAPSGVYQNLRLYPLDNEICNADQEGLLYYDKDDNTVYVCDGSDWQALAGWWAASTVAGHTDDIYNTNINNNVGIGTQSPTQKLDIRGNAYISGNVGIGTTAPSEKLDIDGNVRVRGTNIYLYDPNNPAWQISGIHTKFNWQIYNDDHSEANIKHGWNATQGDFLFLQASENQEKFTISDTKGFLFEEGNVGIGTTAPSEKLDIDGQVKIRGGNPGVDKVLTSDADGVASWETNVVKGNLVTSIRFWIKPPNEYLFGNWDFCAVTEIQGDFDGLGDGAGVRPFGFSWEELWKRATPTEPASYDSSELPAKYAEIYGSFDPWWKMWVNRDKMDYWTVTCIGIIMEE